MKVRGALAVLAVGTWIGAGCSGDERAEPAVPAETATGSVNEADASTGDSLTTAPGEVEDGDGATMRPTTTTSSATGPTTTTTTVPVVTGVPGLDSADAFCAAWSRFGGSWQVVLAAAAFSDDPAAAARLEVLASSAVGPAYDAIFAAWPAELADEQAVVADAYFGAFQRRSADARQALVDAGADDATIAQLAQVWIDALAARDPTQPEIAVAVPRELEPLVAAATEGFQARRVPLPRDPSMVITAETPKTDEYLAGACPDQGAIVGQDVIDG